MNRFSLIAAALLVATAPAFAKPVDTAASLKKPVAMDTSGAAETGKFCIPTKCGLVPRRS